MKKTFLILSFCVLSLSANAQSSSKSKKINQLLELTGSAKMGIQIMDQMINTFKSSHSTVNEQFWEDFKKEIKMDDINNIIIPIYDKYYTENDIDQLIVFYNSPIGKKMISTMPQVMQESIAAGQKIGKEIGEKVITQLKAKGYLEK